MELDGIGAGASPLVEDEGLRFCAKDASGVDMAAGPDIKRVSGGGWMMDDLAPFEGESKG
jgi:hypothetical protein